MKERGMIFNGEMVRALLSGRKTQTRRIIKDCTVGRDQISKFIQIEKKFIGCYPEDVPELIRECCPYGIPGDRIWVRETWNKYGGLLTYRADHDWIDDMRKETVCTAKWVPSIHMPRWASRILLEITDVRVERLNAISEEDARAEGIIDGGCLNCGEPEPCGCANPEPDAADAFAYLWQSIYGQESWNANPWVWVIEFKRVEGGAA
ncbi:TPA: hypothetical protein L9Q10_001081 [Klebsiella pneumoniae]|nr:hypothetical protein [Klebsiella pneumoniae]HBR2587964.1 hypothetical protein [Klebsiella pneumoniae]